ncbi:MAG: prepilin-type N-terminal cleavage/methylation domain-containing protein [Campylobacterota bacterium]|nr:prepilin-type N-terminal cleavage/methylation domain-containing protein [Campylobacterota bacterium]
MRSAFTLVEVIAATAIASIAGLALLQMNSNYAFMFSKLKQSSTMSEQISLIGNHADSKYHRTSKTLYDILDRTYTIDNDDLRKYLKDKKFDYNERLVATISFGEEEMEEEEFSMGDSQETSAAAPIVQFELIQVSIKNSETQGMILHTRPI